MAKIGCERVCWDGVRVTGKTPEVEARVFLKPSNRLIPYGLAETPGMLRDAPVGGRNLERLTSLIYSGIQD